MLLKKACRAVSLITPLALLFSCTGPGPLKTQPPAKVIHVSQELQWGDGILLKQFKYPKGNYVAIQEDSKGWYYIAPQQVKVKEFPFSYTKNGGVYWKRDLQSPEHLYVDYKAGNSYATFKKKGIPYKIIE